MTKLIFGEGRLHSDVSALLESQMKSIYSIRDLKRFLV